MKAITITKNLRGMFGPARDQLVRPTCIAFATSDLHAAVKGPWAELSCEYLYYHAVKRSGGHPKDGVSIANICDALQGDGQPEEAGWPYLNIVPSDLSLWTPPATAKPVFKRNHDRDDATFDEAFALTKSGTPSILAMTISDAFYAPTSDHVIDSAEAVDPARKHAVVVTATGKRGSDNFLQVRNSWGEDWGDEGHAWVSERYLRPRIVKLIALKEAA